MTTPWLEVTETRAIDGAEYVASWTITQAGGIPTEVFVWRADDETYSHVAVVDDLDRWPTSRDTALEAGQGFYRAATATLRRSTLRDLDAAVGALQTRLDELVAAWPGESVMLVPGTDTYVVGGDS